jgi:adenine-specific DNA-methyltransferase
MKARAAEVPEKLRGAYFTPAPIVDYLTRWALAGGPARVLEPCCGDGAFLRAIAARRPERNLNLVVDAIEIDEASAQSARSLAPALAHTGAVLDVTHADFFQWLEGQGEQARWEAVVGNPPYVRYQYLDASQRDRAARLCARAGVTLSKRTNAWVPFVIASAMHLTPGGRLAMVVPAEILHVIHADGLRKWLEREMSSVTVVHLRAMAFSGVLQGVVLLLAVRRKKDHSRREDEGISLTRLRVIDVENEQSLPVMESLSARPVDSHPGFNGQWMRALLTRDELQQLSRIEKQPWARKFTDLASVDIGIVTGANGFFVTDRTTVETYALSPMAHPALARSEHARGVVYTAQDHQQNASADRSVFFLEFPRAPRKSFPSPIRRYLARGEKLGIPERYKCRIRDPWWAVPYVWSAPVALLKRCHGFPRLVLNACEAYSTDTAYRVKLASGCESRPQDLVFSFVNSLTFLMAELEGRSYGGGVLELVPSEIEALRIPLARPTVQQFRKLDAMVRDGSSAEQILDFTDPLILGRAGPGGMSARAIHSLREAWIRLRNRRLRVPA